MNHGHFFWPPLIHKIKGLSFIIWFESAIVIYNLTRAAFEPVGLVEIMEMQTQIIQFATRFSEYRSKYIDGMKKVDETERRWRVKDEGQFCSYSTEYTYARV